jgi:hypothetical protein
MDWRLPSTVDEMDAEERLLRSLAKRAHEQALETGFPSFFDTQIEEVGESVGARPQQVRQVLREMLDSYYLVEDSAEFFKATPRLILLYETLDRGAAYAQNELRRSVLREVGVLDSEHPGALVHFRTVENDPYTAEEVYLAATILASHDFLDMQDGQLPVHFVVKLAADGYDALQDDRLLRRALPVTATEDEDAQAAVAPDALSEVIISCEEMLSKRGWNQALIELKRGDKEYRDKDWVNAVREYYAALESALKYALGAAGDADDDDDKRPLRKLAMRASHEGLIPRNYDALFGFADSIRSPRTHGGGPRADAVGEIEVGQAEALLIGNHTRTLLLYLGQRPVWSPRS